MGGREPATAMITGAFGFTGGAIRRRLRAGGQPLRSLTNHVPRPGDGVEVFPWCFDDPTALARTLEGVDTLYNTYWVRFAHGGATHEQAVENSVRLFDAARRARVRRVVHVSIANPSPDSPLPYYRGKARVEQALVESGLSHAILRPTVLFGDGGILLNNIAWLLRRLPVFAIAGRGDYRLQPAHVDDLADLAVTVAGRSDDVTCDVVGPETYRYRELVELLRETVAARVALVSVPTGVALALARLLGWLLGDVLLTGEELLSLQANLLVSAAPPTCPTRISRWLVENREQVGRDYLSELQRHYRPH